MVAKETVKPVATKPIQQKYPGMGFTRSGMAPCIIQMRIVTKEKRRKAGDKTDAMVSACVVQSVTICKSLIAARGMLKLAADPDSYVQEIWIEDRSRG